MSRLVWDTVQAFANTAGVCIRSANVKRTLETATASQRIFKSHPPFSYSLEAIQSQGLRRPNKRGPAQWTAHAFEPSLEVRQRAPALFLAPRPAVAADTPGQAVDRREQVKRDIGGLIARRVRVRDVVDEGTQRRGPRRRRERFTLRPLGHRHAGEQPG